VTCEQTTITHGYAPPERIDASGNVTGRSNDTSLARLRKRFRLVRSPYPYITLVYWGIDANPANSPPVPVDWPNQPIRSYPLPAIPPPAAPMYPFRNLPPRPVPPPTPVVPQLSTSAYQNRPPPSQPQPKRTKSGSVTASRPGATALAMQQQHQQQQQHALHQQQMAHNQSSYVPVAGHSVSHYPVPAAGRPPMHQAYAPPAHSVLAHQRTIAQPHPHHPQQQQHPPAQPVAPPPPDVYEELADVLDTTTDRSLAMQRYKTHHVALAPAFDAWTVADLLVAYSEPKALLSKKRQGFAMDALEGEAEDAKRAKTPRTAEDEKAELRDRLTRLKAEVAAAEAAARTRKAAMVALKV
jgi:hypothetical protein